MADKHTKSLVKSLLASSATPMSVSDIIAACNPAPAERTLRRWLAEWVKQGDLSKQGTHRATRYKWRQVTANNDALGFLKNIAPTYRPIVLKQLRDLWTHNSTALEGNTLSLGDTHFLLEEGLTVSGKPLKEHQEVVGHAKAIDLIYAMVSKTITQDHLFDLHKAIQTEIVVDIYKPNGAWKLEPNGTYVLTRENKQVYIEYAAPSEVPHLMSQVIRELNTASANLQQGNAAQTYAKFHAVIAHIHPFWDGNGRIARLVSNLPLLKAGLPPLVIPNERRREYIQLLAEYELNVGLIDRHTGPWPNLSALQDVTQFCATCYEATFQLLAQFPD